MILADEVRNLFSFLFSTFKKAKQSLSKNIKRRACLWTLMGLPTLYLIHQNKTIGIIVAILFVLFDEKLKEDYWIALRDIMITHENIILALVLALLLYLL